MLLLTARHQLLEKIRAPPGFAPWAHLDADGTAVCFNKIGDTFIKIYIPFFFAPDKLLFIENGAGRTIDDAATAGFA